MPDYDNSAALILTHGRPDRVHTYDLLKRSGWTRPVYLVIDDEDKTADEYRKRYGDQVIQFSKEEIEKRFDIGDTQVDRRNIIYARNASFDIAEQLGIEYHIQLDDDYLHFEHRWPEDSKLKTRDITRFDDVFNAMAEYLDLSGAHAVAMAQGGDMIGGLAGQFSAARIKRKAMNSFVCRTDRRFNFVGRINEDVNTYVSLGSRGALFFTFLDVDLVQVATQSQAGGISEWYARFGTYVKSFYTVMMHPSSVKIATMHTTNPRIHHHISWEHTVPKIISDRHRKP